MKEPEPQPQLTQLRRLFGQFIPNKKPNDFIQIRPGRKIKIYGATAPKGVWVYRPELLSARGGLKTPSAIASLINNQTLDQVRHQADDALGQLLYRALTNNKRALAIYITTVKESIRMLQRLNEGQRKSMVAEAEKSLDWPVLLSLNPQQLDIAKDQLRDLGVGAKALTRPATRIDPRNLWTKLATDACKVCRDNAKIMPVFRAFAAKARRRYKTDRAWGKKVKATFYYLPGQTDVIIIADWQSKCAKLREPITNDNFQCWWGAIKGCVLEYWRAYKTEYQKALKKIGREGEQEYVRRSLAMTQVHQAFQSLVGLRSKGG